MEIPRTLFTWTLQGGHGTVDSDTLPAAGAPVIELIFNRNPPRFAEDGVRPHMEHPKHAHAMKQGLPTTLQILRMDGCRLRQFPTLPQNIMELYADKCDFFSLPNLSHLTELIVIELKDNRLEKITQPLPPRLVRLNVENNALRYILCKKPDTMDPENLITRENPNLTVVWGEPLIPILRYNINGSRYRNIHRPTPDTNKKQQNVYANSQNVHDSSIQKSGKANLDYICSYKPSIHSGSFSNATVLVKRIYKTICKTFDIGWWRRVLGMDNNAAKVRKELEDRLAIPYTMYGHTIYEIINNLWMRIVDFPSEIRKEVMQRFIEEVLDSASYCTNGFVIRMSNVLIGFDPKVTVWLEPSKIIQARTPATMSRIRKEKKYEEGEEPFEYWCDVVNATWADMLDVEMEFAHREEWLQPLFEPIVEDCVKGLTRLAFDLRTVKDKESIPNSPPEISSSAERAEGSYDRLIRLGFTNDEELYEILCKMMRPFAERTESTSVKPNVTENDDLSAPLLV